MIRALVMSFVCASLAARADPVLPLRVEAVATVEHGNSMIQFSVSNVSASPITMYTADLPWGGFKSVLIVGSTRQHETLPAVPPLIDDPGPQKTTIEPGQTLRGEKKLSRHIRGVDTERRKQDVIVLWLYEARDQNAQSKGSYVGWIALSRE